MIPTKDRNAHKCIAGIAHAAGVASGTTFFEWNP